MCVCVLVKERKRDGENKDACVKIVRAFEFMKEKERMNVKKT